jgi:hypothetical protein
MFVSAITTVFALAIISPTLNGAQERVCGVASTARELFWWSLGYQQAQPTAQTPSFHEIIKTGSFEQIEAAIQKEKEARPAFEHFDPFFDIVDSQGFAPIHYAAQRGDADIVLLLLQSGCSAKQTVRNTNATPLHLAAQQGHMDAACVLLRGNTDRADVNAQDAIKNSPAHYAFKNGHIQLGTYFIKNCGAIPTLLNRERKTPEQCAPAQSSSESGYETKLGE